MQATFEKFTLFFLLSARFQNLPVNLQVLACEHVENHLFYACIFVFVEPAFYCFYCNLGGEFLGKSENACGNAAERNAFKSVLRGKVQAACVARGELDFIAFGYTGADYRTDRVQNVF